MKVYEYPTYSNMLAHAHCPGHIIICPSFPFKFMASCFIYCKNPKTAVNRMFRTLKNDKRFSKYFPLILDMVALGKLNFENNEFLFRINKIADNYYYVYINA